MLSWLMLVAALSQASRPAICSGDQPCRRRSSTRRRSSPSRSRRDTGPAPGFRLLMSIGSACSRPACPGCASAREKSSMAGDPELPRFGGRIARLHEDGQSGTVLPMTGAHIAFPLQHLRQVLHFVCELRESRPSNYDRRTNLAIVGWFPRSTESSRVEATF